MNKTLITIVATCLFSLSAGSQDKLTSREIYRINHEAVVQINVGEFFSGDGFLISSDGVVATANHVVATGDSHFREYSNKLSVVVFSGNTFRAYPAVPIVSSISADQANYDYAFLKIEGTNFPHVKLGDWNQIDIGSLLVIITSFPNVGPSMMLEGAVSGKTEQGRNPDLGPKPFDTFVFQCPIRKGFSGAPIFSSKGTVVGIVDTEVFGITPALNSLHATWKEVSKGGITIVGGGASASLSDSFVELIDNLDQNLISGLGSGVAIDYAKQQQKAKQSVIQH
jgi:S1-C subfamily serine protease